MRVAGSHTDITEQVELKASLTRYKEISEKLFGETAMLVLLTDMKGQLVELSPYTEKFLGYQAEAFADKGFWEVILQKDRHEEVASIFCGTCENKKIYNLELSVISQAGQKYSVIWNTERLHNDSGEMIGTMAIGVDITERKAMEEKLHRLAYTDLVTGLPNRAMLEETVEHLMGNPHEEFALLYFDIDDFGHINGSLGYEAGDAVLKLVGDVINTEVAQPDQAIHLGSDSFAILMRSSLCMEEINEKARACMNRMKKPWHYQDHEIYLSFCMGISRFPQDADSFATLLQTANAALTSAKELGKDSICTYTSEMREQVDKRIIFGNRLRHALRNQAFFLHYQPLVDLKTQRMYGVEALIRWHDDKNGFIPPNTFIPLAEEIGLIEEIDLWVFENCCRQIRDWRSGRMVIPVMSINLSGKALVSAGLVEKLSGIMVQYAIEGEDIQIEITETAAMEDFDRAIEAIMGLRSLGIKIALDDFGSGYSSLTYLQMLPIDVLKIDRSFISTIQDSAEAAFIYETIVRLAHHLDLKVISEGIETEAQLEFVRSLGSDMAQGYFLEKPVSAEEIVRLFEHVFNWKMNSAIKEEKSS
jgi:diguanylate cyclase (GGDEF)-like protein/PAS domain S-box-containing protein